MKQILPNSKNELLGEIPNWSEYWQIKPEGTTGGVSTNTPV
ncbi:hypothetical protein ACOI1C_13885 [Bacillus sp. DJP31]